MGKKQFTYFLRLFGIMTGTTIVSLFLNGCGIGKENTLMIFMVGVLLVGAVAKGYHFGMIASIGSVLIFNYFFTVPLHTFAITNTNDIILMVFFLIASLISSNLADRFQKQLKAAQSNEKTARLLHRMSERFFNVTGRERIIKKGTDCVYEYTGFDSIVELMEDEHVEEAPGIRATYQAFPIIGFSKQIGVLRVYNRGKKLSMEQELLVKMTASQLGIALDRDQIYKEQESIKIAMEKEHMRNRVLRSISHDLRTPLTGIVGASSLILDSDESLELESVKELVGDIKEQATWLTQIVENILNMTKIESGSLVLSKQLEAVEDIVNEAAAHVPGLRTKRTLIIQLPQELTMVLVDGRMIVQVLVNLLNNAMRYTKEQEKIRIKVSPTEDQRVWFYVKDEGEGIEESIQGTLFDEFVTYTGESSDGKKGIGLGLTICQAVVNAHGGEITAYNTKNGGAEFAFWLPSDEEDSHE